MGTRKLTAAVEVAGTWYPAGTEESKVSAEHRKLITNPDVWADEDDGVTAPDVVQAAPVYGLAPGDVPADQVDPRKAAPKKAAPVVK